MSFITWIIIVLIVISIAVTVTEVGLRFAILEKEKSSNGNLVGEIGLRNWMRSDFSEPQLQAICGAEVVGKTFAEL
jgi:hypothetical protein